MGFSRSPVDRDIAELVGAMMFVLGGNEMRPEQVKSLTFVAEGALEAASNEAFITLLEFAHDQEQRLKDPMCDRAMRRTLELSLQNVITTAGPGLR